MKTIRNIVSINEELCNGCGQCILDCAEGAIRLVDGKARVIADILCDGLGNCIGGCPTGALSIVAREADPFDEEAVERHLASGGPDDPGAGECPGARSQRLQPLSPLPPLPPDNAACPGSRPASALLTGAPGRAGNSHWPLKLRLMSPDAPFLRGADLLLAADCAAFAAPEAYGNMRAGMVPLIACPKFEGTDALAERLEALIRTAGPRSITIMLMEVPCCQGLARACELAVERAKVSVPVRRMVLSRQGGTCSA